MSNGYFLSEYYGFIKNQQNIKKVNILRYAKDVGERKYIAQEMARCLIKYKNEVIALLFYIQINFT